MQRRDFVKKAALGAAAGSMLAACGGNEAQDAGGDAPAVQTQENVRWRLASSFTRSLDTIFGAAEVMANRVQTLTNGRFQIRVYPAGEVVPGLEVLGAVQQNTVQMGHSASYYYIGKNPTLAFDATVPFGLTARQYNAWMYYGGGMSLMRNVFSDFNVVNFPGGNTGTQMGGWFTTEIGSLSDMQGLRMRIPGLGGRVMNEMGVTVQNIAGGEIYPALERGTIDATEWVGPYDDMKLGFHEIAKNYYYPGWWEPGPAISFYINRSAWDSLSSTYKEVLASACEQANLRMLARYDNQNPGALETLIAEHGVNVQPFPDDVMEESFTVSRDLLEQEASQNQQYRKVFNAYRRFRRDAYRWFNTAEQGYASFAFPRIAEAAPAAQPG